MIFILTAIAVALVAGIFISEYVDVYFLSLLVLILIAINKPLQKIFKTLKTHYNWIFIAFLLGCILSSSAQSYQMNGLYPFDDKFVTLSGYISEIPEENEGRFTYIIRTDRAEYKDRIINAVERVRFTSEIPLDYSQRIEISGFLKRIDPPGNRSDFNYNLYFKSKGIFYKISDYKIKEFEKEKLFSPVHFVNLFKMKVTDLFLKNFSKEDTAVLKAVTTGNRNGFSDEFSDVLYKTGIMAMMYPSYLHILLLTMFINIPLFFLKRNTRDKIILAILFIYMFFNFEKGAHLKNAILVMSVIFTTRVLGYVRYIDALSMTVSIILVFNPLIVYQPGFVISVWLNFILLMTKDAVFSVISFVRPYFIRKNLSFLIIFTIGTPPLLAYYFYGMNILSPFLNIILLPLVGLMFVFSGVYVLETSLLGVSFAGEKVLDILMSLFYKIVDIANAIPLTHIDMEKPSILVIIIVMLFAIGIKLTYTSGIRDTKTKTVLVMISGFMMALVLSGFINSQTLYISFINVGQGDSSLIKLPQNYNVLVDGGGSEEFSDYDVGEEILVPYLKSEGIYKIDMAIVTHFHKDHCDGIISVLKNMRVKNLVMPFSYSDNEYRKELLRYAKKQRTNIINVRRKDVIKLTNNAKIDIISPYERNPEEENDSSVVFNFTYDDFRVLFTGDMSSKTELRFLDDFEKVDILKVAHHGSKTSTSQELLDKIKPDAAVISVGEDNMYLLPDEEVVERLEKSGARIFTTEKNGDIIFAVKKGKMKVNTFR